MVQVLPDSEAPTAGITLRVLHGPTDVGGNPSGLVAAERARGLDSRLVVFERSPFGYDVDVDLRLGGRSQAVRLATRTRLAMDALRSADVVHLNFGRTLLPHRAGIGIDLPVLRAAGRTLCMSFLGCDARQVGYCGAHYDVSCCGDGPAAGRCRAEDDASKRAVIAYAHRHCHRLFCFNPDLLRVVPAADFVPYTSVDPARLRPDGRTPTGPIRIVHAPTNRAVKGTDDVLAAVARVREQIPLELDIVEGVTRDDAIERFRAADLIIDQLRVGWYGGLAVEAMALGKPVVAYIRPEDLELIPPAMAEACPVVSATAGTLADVLRDLLPDRARLASIGAQSRAFVEAWHDPADIARRMHAVYADPSSSFW